MADFPGIGRVLLIAGLSIAAIGLFMVIAGRLPGFDRLGKLPGDIAFQRGPVTIFVPIVSSIALSLILTLILNLLLRK